MKFIEVEISRKQYTTVTVSVPDDFDVDAIDENALLGAARAAPDWDWDKDESNVEVESYTEVAEAEARQYAVTDITEALREARERASARKKAAEEYLAARKPK